MFAHGSNGFLPLSKLSVFVDEVLCSAERLGCSVEQRSSTRDQIVLTFTRLYTIKLVRQAAYFVQKYKTPLTL